MKKIIVFLVIFLSGSFTFAEEIKLVPDEVVERKINLEINNPELMENSSQQLKNQGFVLQNSITPVRDLKYNSNYIPKERNIPDKIPAGE